MLQKYEDSMQFLVDNPDLVCEETANYLVVWCIDLEIEEVSGQKIDIRIKIFCCDNLNLKSNITNK